MKKDFSKEVLFVIRKGFEPLTHSLEGCCSNPTELPNHPFRFCECKGRRFIGNMQILEQEILKKILHVHH